jgi:ABC-type branched-subunit amino acid transport system permease subunit
VLSVRWGVPPALGAVAAMVGTALSAFVIGLPALRLRGHYLSMATLGFNAILSVLFNELVPVTGGPNGLSGIPPINLFGFTFHTPMRFFWLAWLAGMVLMLIVARCSQAARVGRCAQWQAARWRRTAWASTRSAASSRRSSLRRSAPDSPVRSMPTSISTHRLTPSASRRR